MNSNDISPHFSKQSRRLFFVLVLAVLFSIGLSAALAPTLTVQAGFTPTPVPPTPTNTPVPTLTPTTTPATPGNTAEPAPLLPQTGGVSWLPMVVLLLIVLAIVGFGWAGLNRSNKSISHK